MGGRHLLTKKMGVVEWKSNSEAIEYFPQARYLTLGIRRPNQIWSASSKWRTTLTETDSFIEEVSDEVRRDKLFGFFKKYAWVFGALVVLIVGGAAVNEYLTSQKRGEAQASGEAMIAATETATAAAFAELAGGDAPIAVLAKMNQAILLASEGQVDAGAAILDGIAADGDVSAIYRELALLKMVMINGENMPAADLMTTLDQLSAEGAPFRLLALEQRAIVHLRSGDKAAAVQDMAVILVDPNATQDLRTRTQELTVSLGGDLATTQ